jgi:hypothetical protein
MLTVGILASFACKLCGCYTLLTLFSVVELCEAGRVIKASNTTCKIGTALQKLEEEDRVHH